MLREFIAPGVIGGRLDIHYFAFAQLGALVLKAYARGRGDDFYLNSGDRSAC